MHMKAAWNLSTAGNGSAPHQQYLAMVPQQQPGVLAAKRPREDDNEERDGKRGRFELIE